MSLKLTHWEYSFILHTTNLGDSTRATTNPFTGEQMELPVDNGLSMDQIDSVSAVLARYNVHGPDPDTHALTFECGRNEKVSFYHVEFRHGKRICNFEASALTKELSDRQLTFIRDVACAGKFALMSGVGEHVRLVEQAPDDAMLKRWPGVQTISGIAELRWWFESVLCGRKCAVLI